MLAMAAMNATPPAGPWRMDRRRLLLAAASLGLSGCVGELSPSARPTGPLLPPDGEFTMRDGARLPYRAWLPPEPAGTAPWAVVLALHGFNDSRDAWEIPAPWFMRAGIALYAPDQRGFGQAPGRGYWPGSAVMVADAAQIARQLRARYPQSRLYLIGESMGGAVLMRLATSRGLAPPADGYVMAAPAVWGRAEMNIFLRASLWVAVRVAPGWSIRGGGPIQVWASDNRAALHRLSTDPLTLHDTRMDTLNGLVDLMDGALAAARDFSGPALFLYGGKDELVPDHATRAAWRALEASGDRQARIAYYPHDYHLLLRDLGRAAPIGDALAWIRNPAAPLPSHADLAAAAWLGAGAAVG
jgi:acylglycerol lipase